MMEDNLRCRLCSKTEATTSFIHVLDEEDIRTKINNYLSLDVKKCDGLPTSICILCYGKLDNFHEFVVSIRKVQEELASAAKNEETPSNIDPENGVTYHDFESETKYNPICNMQKDAEIPIKQSRKRRSIPPAKPTRKSNRFKLVSQSKKNACIQVGSTLAADLETLKKTSSFQFQHLQGLEILALLPAKLNSGCSVSQDSKTSKSCQTKLNLGVKMKSGEILMAPNSDSKSKQLIKLPFPRISQ